ncbi:enoyl-CoA hydratase/isomerase family protein [Rhizorhabdus sp.]|jgi:enoyl-CoA hydratase/carnithine racemase|uniref:enoyl-CoA hydratase/isomerase family protein n=1 Tax=Rhizorhabdus sp. TaxID=1968843 RepID=UPI0019C689FC|nr:enoyl-CoA hydratase/isomerase family protein [Rhizorhabdus sp.]MBD3759619.1 enoyl-CoA hydratase/isomerase family protein [Rhizorhabdus sp.]
MNLIASDIQADVTSDGIARISFNRPEVANAVRPQTMEQLCHAIDRANADRSVRAIVIGGIGRNFAAGADFGFLEDLLTTDSAAVNDSLYTWFKGATERLWKSPKPTVAAVRGAAITVGCEIALCCDARIAAPSSRFGENWLQLGLMPPLGGAMLLPRIVGLTHAKRMILEAEIVDGERALAIGLVDELVAEDDVAARAEDRARAMAALPAAAFAAAKAALHRGLQSSMEHEWAANVMNQAMLIASADFRAQVEMRLKANSARKPQPVSE